MKVFPISYSELKKRPTFNSCIRSYRPKADNLNIFSKDTIKTSTNLFREDLNWKFLLKYIVYCFMNEKKVNVYSLASSDGSEAYSFATLLMSKLPKLMYKKFFPIIASDIDTKVLKNANKRRINIHDFEFAYTKTNYHIDLNNYFKNKGKPEVIENDDIDWTQKDKFFSYEPIDELKQAVQFKQSDILTELSKIRDDGNSVVLCRNVFPYLKEKYVNDVVTKAGLNLKTGSFFVIGSFDESINIIKELECYDFYRPVPEHKYIFRKA